MRDGGIGQLKRQEGRVSWKNRRPLSLATEHRDTGICLDRRGVLPPKRSCGPRRYRGGGVGHCGGQHRVPGADLDFPWLALWSGVEGVGQGCGSDRGRAEGALRGSSGCHGRGPW